jgi:hypothetical protein
LEKCQLIILKGSVHGMQNTKKIVPQTMRSLLIVATLAMGFLAFQTASVAAVQHKLNANSFTRTISRGGTITHVSSAPFGAPGIASPEINTATNGLTAHAATTRQFAGVNRALSHASQNGAKVNGSSIEDNGYQLAKSFDGLNFFQQRFANNGNQFSVEPPDQGLCSGNGFVMETVNDVLNVYSTAGKSLLGATALNAFYGYAPAINRTTGVRGPFVTDPSCYYDSTVRRWFHVVLTLDTDPKTGAFLGSNHLDLAVSQSSDPTGGWVIYTLPVQDDGTQGTPNHMCDQGPCLGDYPHIGADAHGFYITTNEYPFFGNGFHAAQIYVFSKTALAHNDAAVGVTDIDTIGSVNGNPGFTVWPSESPDGQFAEADHGTEYFLSSTAADEANGNHTSSQLVVWTLSNTSSITALTSNVSLVNTILPVLTYTIPARATQKTGNFPLGQCLNTPACSTVILGAPDPFAPEQISQLDTNDTRMQQVVYAHGRIWGALDTGLLINGAASAGIETFVVNPTKQGPQLTSNSYYGVFEANLTYPAIAVTADGQVVMAFTLVGPNNFPTAAYAIITEHSISKVHIAAAGKGPQDGFSGYKAFGNPPRPRWGDYGAAVAIGNSIWFASEYIGQTCTLQTYEATNFTCNNTRAALGNWDTRISRVSFEG